MSKRCRRSGKPWDGYDDVIHYPDGSWSGKSRWSIEAAKDFLAKQSLFGLEKDEKGYYSTVGELVCTAD